MIPLLVGSFLVSCFFWGLATVLWSCPVKVSVDDAEKQLKLQEADQLQKLFERVAKGEISEEEMWNLVCEPDQKVATQAKKVCSVCGVTGAMDGTLVLCGYHLGQAMVEPIKVTQVKSSQLGVCCPICGSEDLFLSGPSSCTCRSCQSIFGRDPTAVMGPQEEELPVRMVAAEDESRLQEASDAT